MDVVCDAHYLPFKNACFDGCFAYALLEHVDNPLLVLKEINRVLKVGGWLRVLVPTDSRLRSDYVRETLNLKFKSCFRVYRFMKVGEHKWQFSERSLKRILTKKGFIVNKVEYPLHLWFHGRKGKILGKLGLVRHPQLIIEAQKIKGL